MDIASNRPGLEIARLIVLLSGGALAAMVQLAILPSLPQIAAHYAQQGTAVLDGASIAQLVMTVAAPTIVVGAPLIGWLSGRIGKRRALLASALLYALAGAAGAFAPNLWMLLFSRIALGLGAAGIMAVTTAYLGDYYPPERRDRLIGWTAFIGGGGALVVLVAAGALAEIGWRAPFGLYLIGLLIFALTLPAIAERPPAVVAAPSAEPASIGGIAGILTLIVLISLVLYMPSIQGPFLLEAKGFGRPATQAAIADATTVGAMTGSYLFGLLRPRLRFTSILFLLLMAMGIGTVGYGVADNIVAIALFAGLCGFGSGFMAPLTQSAILNIVSPAAASRAIGLAVGCIFLGQFLHPFALALLRAAAGIEGAFLWVGMATIGGGLLALLWRIAARPAAMPVKG